MRNPEGLLFIYQAGAYSSLYLPTYETEGLRNLVATGIGSPGLCHGIEALIRNDVDYWIKEDSKYFPFGIQSHDIGNTCPYYLSNVLSVPGIDRAQCDSKKGFICEVNSKAADMFICPTEWYKFGNMCYKKMTVPMNYTISTMQCSRLNSHLAILDDSDKERQVSAVIFRQNTTFLVDAKRVDGAFKWSSGKEFQPQCVDCVEHSTGDCLGYKSDPQHPLEFSWVYLDCSTFHPFICSIGATLRNTTSTIPPPPTTQTPTTTSQPLQCPVGYNWKAHEESGYCYWETTYEADKLNWYQAREFCKAYGGDLASYQNNEQERHGLGGALGHYRGLWFGLRRRNTDFYWMDGSPLNYTHWSSYSDLDSRSKFCGVHGPDDGRWELDYCGVRRWFICKSTMVRNPTLPDLDKLFKKTPCEVSSPSIYRHQWFLHKDHCYMVHENPSYSWSMAQNFCNDNEAHLASIHSFEETDFVLSLASLSSNTDYWIGLSSIGIGSSREWADETPVDFTYWEDNALVSDQIGINSCVTFNKQRGFWQTEHCNKFLGVVCKRNVNSSFELPTPQPTVLLPGNCEKGWYGLGNQCYKTFGERWSQRRNWAEAKESCEDIGASLASIHTKEEQDFLTDMLLDLGCDAWIGLQGLNMGTAYEWCDDTSLDYVNWDVNEPAQSFDDEEIFFGVSSLGHSIPSNKNSCIKLSSDIESIIGKWRDVGCSYKNSYICQKPKNASITEPSEDLFVCSNITGWNRLGSSCYGVFNDSLPWNEAQKKCRTFNADLVSFDNSLLSIFLQKRLGREFQFYWTGIRLIAENEYGFLNGHHLEFSNWLPGQPQKVSTLMDNCVAMNLNTNWVVQKCEESFPFVCQWNSDHRKTEAIVERRHMCPNISEWVDIGTDTCYLFNLDSRLSWNDAMTYCFRHGGHLASFHSAKEAEIVRQHIVDNTAASFVHIGLGKRRDGSYAWVDHSPLNYLQWEDDQQEGDDACVQLFIRDGKWRSVDCDVSMRGFICSSTRDTKYNASDVGTTNSHTGDMVNTKLAVGGFIGIAICAMVVLAIISVTVYYVCPVTRMRVKLLDSP